MGEKPPTDVAQLGLDINRALMHKRGDDLIVLIAQYMKTFDMTASSDVISKIPVGGTGENIA